MSFLRDLIIFKWLFGGTKAKAKYDENGNPICGECRTAVDEHATTCSGCSATLYTWRGLFGRRIIGGLGAIWLLAIIGAMMSAESVFHILGFVVFAIPGVIAVLMGIHWYRNKPVRELNVREAVPLLSEGEIND